MKDLASGKFRPSLSDLCVSPHLRAVFANKSESPNKLSDSSFLFLHFSYLRLIDIQTMAPSMVNDNGSEPAQLLGPESASERTLYPYVTGTSVVALKYKDGILMAADMGASYGSTLRYKSVERIKSVGKHSLLGASGEISDFQEILRYLDELILYDNMWDDGNSLGPKEVHNYLTRVMYNRRNKFNPLWNSLVLGGVKNGQKYLGMVSMIGVNFEDNHVATGFGNHLARPILRDEWHENLSFEDGVKLLEKCMRVLLYRDRSAVNKLQIAKITEEGVTISQPYALKTFWGFSAFQNPTVGAEGSW
ncbi:proteasome subunit beta type-4 [Manihot esculenta]|uniref:Uncharacterized protein n=2 Tax=Manihot esculenta TaxID=3983 RepID=A0ACB7HU03_MANES|nr:proteasome subunit beta type-4 [Manihot esculenta]KAG8655283.1 hypothetical protein MANES_04G024700v8 [Manihot esculenta]